MAADSMEKTGAIKKIREALNEQPWFLELKGKWDELDSQSQTYAKWGAAGVAGLFLFIFLISSWWGVRSIKSEVRTMETLLATIRQATLEKRGFQSFGNLSAGAPPQWLEFFNSTAGMAGVPETNISVESTGNGSITDYATEKLFSLTVNGINIRQMVGLALKLETSPYPVKIRRIDMQTAGTEGAVNGQFDVSAYEVKPERER